MRGAGGGRGFKAPRREAVRLKSAKQRSLSSQLWLKRQLNDPYVAEAKRRGLRSRAAFKLIEIDDRFRILKRGLAVVDLGAAPGGWSQVAVERVGAGVPGGGWVVAIDREAMAEIAGATVLRGDMTEDGAVESVRAALGGDADVVLSDMSPATVGHAATDHLRIVALVEAAAEFALETLAPGGAFVAKVFAGGTERQLLARLKRAFAAVRHVKPAASRKESAEIYLVATGFRGRGES
jgi:23S rRNA (uridine2552-2'-O)-methyltransferase